VPPEGRSRSARDVLRTADRVEKVREARREHPGSTREAFLKGPGRWQVSYYDDTEERRREIAQVLVDDDTGAVLEAWTGYQVPWTMARGYDGAFGRKVNSPWVWLPLCALFLVPFARRPLRWLHLDLLVLLGFSVGLAFFNAANIGVSTPFVYPLLAYLLVRMLAVGLRRRGAEAQARRPLPLLVPVVWLAIGAVFLLGFRVALNVTASNVIDVGYSGVIGADKLADGERLYGYFPPDNAHGDTYGPVNYLAYVPFEQALPWSGQWDDLPAARAAALTFDALCVLLLFLLGRRVRGPGLGIVLAYSWLAFPFTLYVSNSNANDALPAALVLAALLAATSAPARGALVALAGMTKFYPFALAPLFALHRPPDRPDRHGRRRVPAFALAFLLVLAVTSIPIFLHGGDLRTFWEATLGFQADRGAPFSVWGLYEWPTWTQRIVQGAAILLALAVAVLPRRGDVAGLAALSAAIVIALQLGADYWFYLYIVWFFPLVMVALLARHAEPAR
jgi:hypothetical protein